MSVKLSRIRDRVNGRIRNFDFRGNESGPAYSDVEVDQELCSEYLAIQSMLPAAKIYTASAFTISAGTDTFQLPATVTQWTGNDGGAEYRGAIRIQLVSNGGFLDQVSLNDINRYRNFQPVIANGIPYIFALYEDTDQDIQGICYPPTRVSEACNLFRDLEADDLRDFVGSGAQAMDDVEVQMSRVEALALELRASAGLVAKMSSADLDARRLNPNAVSLWINEAAGLIHAGAAVRLNIRDSRPYRYTP
jgi:hypothetical protein